MQIGVVANVLQDKTLKEALQIFHDLGIKKIEPGCGGFAGKAHIDPERLLSSPEEIEELKNNLKENDISISALSCHGNPVHPDKAKAKAYRDDMCNTVRLAQELGVDTITCFSGCPGDCEQSQNPNWVTCAWPDDYLKILDYQWNEILIPYWKSFVSFARDFGVNKIAFELHPGFCVYNVDTMLRLRNAVGPELGVNFDPSHLLWQGMNPVTVIRAFEGMIFHVHAKDVCIDHSNTERNGVLDTKHYSDEAHRSWLFRTIGYGNDAKYWKDIFSELRKTGYDGTISIEHEDSIINRMEGLQHAVDMIRDCAIFAPRSGMWWA